MQRDDLVRLRHIRDSATEAKEYVGARPAEEFAADRLSLQATVRCLEVLGEAANALSKEFTQAHPQIPWHRIVAMRNRLIHAYFDVDAFQVWQTVSVSLPPLLEFVQDQLARHEANSSDE